MVSRLSTAAHRQASSALDDIRRHLDVAYVVRGSFASQSGKARLQAELCEVRTGTVLWADAGHLDVADKSLKGMRWSLLKDRSLLKPEAAADLDALIAKMTTVRTARAWVYKEQLREFLERKQINVVRTMLQHWCACVMRSKVEPMKNVAALVRRHLEGIAAWAQTRQTNGFLEAIKSLFQAAKRRARGFVRLSTIKTVIFLIAANSTSTQSILMPNNPLEIQQSRNSYAPEEFLHLLQRIQCATAIAGTMIL